MLRRQEVTFISGIFTAHARVWVSGRSRTVWYGKTTKLAYCWLCECFLPLFLCFIGCFTADRLDQFIEEVLVNGLRFKMILLFGLAQFSSDNFGRLFSHSGQDHVWTKPLGRTSDWNFKAWTRLCALWTIVPFWWGNGANCIIDEPAKSLSSGASHV